ncbi:MAG: exo-alpha-sialidase [bacterium]|nr:exo-alpha-sialidase [bacterium]
MRVVLILCLTWAALFAGNFVEFPPEAIRNFRSPLDDAGPAVRMNQDTIGRRQNEITMAAWIQNPRVVMGGSNDYRNGDASGGFYVSTDGGYTFYDALVTRGPDSVFEASGDPVAAIDRNGRLYANYISFDRTTDDGGLYVQTSDDSGLTWSAPIPIAEHINEPGADFEDKPYAWCDVSPTSPYVNTHYVTWTRFFPDFTSPIFFAHSIDSGTAYSPPIRISESDACQFSCPATGPNGEIYAVWMDFWTARFKFDKSLDGGVTWGNDVTVAQFWSLQGQANPCGTFRTPSYPMIACDISDGPHRGYIYICWVTFNGTDPDVRLSVSTDGGTTWSASVQVDDGPVGTWQWWQWMSVHPETGDLGIGWLDRRDDPTGCLYRPYATVSTDGGQTFAPSYPLTDVMSDPTVTNFLGDYNGATFRQDGGFYYGWVDTRNDAGDAYSAWFRPKPPAPQGLVITQVNDDARLDWTPVEAATYEVYSSLNPEGPFVTLVGATADTFMTDINAFPADEQRFYVVKAVAE